MSGCQVGLHSRPRLAMFSGLLGGRGDSDLRLKAPIWESCLRLPALFGDGGLIVETSLVFPAAVWSVSARYFSERWRLKIQPPKLLP